MKASEDVAASAMQLPLVPPAFRAAAAKDGSVPSRLLPVPGTVRSLTAMVNSIRPSGPHALPFPLMHPSPGTEGRVVLLLRATLQIDCLCRIRLLRRRILSMVVEMETP